MFENNKRDDVVCCCKCKKIEHKEKTEALKSRHIIGKCWKQIMLMASKSLLVLKKCWSWIENHNAIALIALIVSAAALFVSFRTYTLEKENDVLQLQPDGDDERSDKSWTIRFRIEQGSVQKAYLASWEDDDYDYTDVTEYCGRRIIRIPVNTDQSDKIGEVEEELIQSENTELLLTEIPDLALVLLDKTGQWTVYYYVSSPEISMADASYVISVTDENGDLVLYHEQDVKTQKSIHVMIDGTLTNEKTIEPLLGIYDGVYYLYGGETTLTGVNGEKFTVNPRVEDAYVLPDAEEIYENINLLYKEIGKADLD